MVVEPLVTERDQGQASGFDHPGYLGQGRGVLGQVFEDARDRGGGEGGVHEGQGLAVTRTHLATDGLVRWQGGHQGPECLHHIGGDVHALQVLAHPRQLRERMTEAQPASRMNAPGATKSATACRITFSRSWRLG